MIAFAAPDLDSDVGEAPLDAGPIETPPCAEPATADAHADAGAPAVRKPSAPSLATGDPETIDLERLGDEIATLAAHIHAATYRLLVLIRAFDEREGWGGGGFRSCAHWLSWRTGISLGPCREKVRVAHALAELPRISEAMARGEMSFSKVRAMTRRATPANEEELLNVARHAPASHLEQLVRAWRRVDRLEDAEEEAARHRSRNLQLWPAEDGSWVLRGRLDPEVGALLQTALEWAGEALYRREAGEAGDTGGAAVTGKAEDTGEEETSPEQRWADALGLVVERAMVQRTLDEGGAGAGADGSAGAAGEAGEGTSDGVGERRGVRRSRRRGVRGSQRSSSAGPTGPVPGGGARGRRYAAGERGRRAGGRHRGGHRLRESGRAREAR